MINNVLLPINETPSKLMLINMLIVGEDHRFRLHPGVDVIAICRAIYKNLRFGTHEGASTIEQQLVRVITGKYERTFARKISEIRYAVILSLRYDKKILAWNYLLSAYYGTNYSSLNSILSKYGYTIDDDVPLEICAEVVARLKYPEPKNMSLERVSVLKRRVHYIMSRYNIYKNKNIFLFHE